MKELSYAQRRAKEKKQEEAKTKAVKEASKVLEDLWKMTLTPNNRFTALEAQAISEAEHKLRGVLIGWVNRRSRR